MQRFTLGIALIAVAACGDNSEQCGPGTTSVKNVCVPSVPCGPGTKLDADSGACVPDGSVVCTDGTKFDAMTGTCVLDPNACRDGTVLVNDTCQDPTGGLVIDVEEGPEPNGLNFIEPSANPAGLVPALKPIGGTGIVLHGYIAPFRDIDADGLLDPDIDTYLVTVTGPTLLRVTADGVGGILGAFAVVANVGANDPLAQYLRVGMSVTGDLSKRELLLPAAGQYVFAIGDSRTFYQYTTGGPVDAAPGGGEYYVTIEQIAMPAPTPLTGTENATISFDETRFYAPAMGSGANLVTLGTTYPQLRPAMTLMQNGATRATGTTSILSAGFTATDDAVIAVDPIFNVANGAVPFTLTLETSTATPLATDGTAVTPVTEQRSAPIATAHDYLSASQFSFDAMQADQTFGIDLAWTQPVRGTLLDADLVPVGPPITALAGPLATWTTYHGLVRVPKPGRYYFVVIDPAGTPGTTTLGVTSRVQPFGATPVALGMPTGNVALDATFHTTVFDYSTSAQHPWQLFDATSTNTGGHVASWFAASTYGRLDPVTTTAGVVAGAAPLFAHAYGEGGGAFGRIMLDDPSTHYVVKVDPQTAAAGQTVNLAFDDRAYTDLGTITAGAAASATDRMLDATNTPGLYLFRTNAGNRATITVHPHVPASLDTRFVRIDNLESAAAPVVDTSSTGDDVELLVQGGGGWTAFVVFAAAAPASPQLYDVSVGAAAAVAYTRSAGTTAFADACATGTAIPLADDGTGFGDPADEGLTSALAAPAGFTFYGLPTTTFRVSSNGWLSFGPVANAAFANQHIPDHTPPNAVIAPYWSDLFGTSICYLATGTKVIVQWDATSRAGGQVHAQAILDGADSTIELVWASTETALGAAATIGIEDPAGANASVHAVDDVDAIVAGTSRRFTPM